MYKKMTNRICAGLLVLLLLSSTVAWAEESSSSTLPPSDSSSTIALPTAPPPPELLDTTPIPGAAVSQSATIRENAQTVALAPTPEGFAGRGLDTGVVVLIGAGLAAVILVLGLSLGRGGRRLR